MASGQSLLPRRRARPARSARRLRRSCSCCASRTRTRPTASRSSTSSRSSCSRSSSAASRACSAEWRRSRCSRSGPRSKTRTWAPSPTSCAASSFVVVGWLTGQMAERLRSTAEEAATAARHFELARDLLCTASFDGYLVRLNGAWEETLGWTSEELMARPFIEFVHPDDRERTALSAAALRAGERPPPLLNRYLTKDGGHRWIEWSSRADHEHELIHAAARDVTDRREAEQRHARGGAALPPLVRGLPDRDGARRRARRRRRAGSSRSTRRSSRSPASRATSSSARARSRSSPIPTTAASCARGWQRRGERRAPDVPGRVPHARAARASAGSTSRRRPSTAPTARRCTGSPSSRTSTRARRGEEQLRHFADHDTLSGLFNRRRFNEELERELS